MFEVYVEARVGSAEINCSMFNVQALSAQPNWALDIERGHLRFNSPGNSHPLEELHEVLQLQRVRDIPNAAFPLAGIEIDDSAQFGERCASLARPLHHVGALASATHREIVTDDPKREIVRDEIGAWKEEERARGNEAKRVDDEPEPVLLKVASELPAKQRDRPMRFEVVRKKKTCGTLAAQVPEQPLFRDRFRDVAKSTRLDATQRAARRFIGVSSAPLTLRFRQHRVKSLFHAREKTGRHLLGLRLGLFRPFAIEFVPIVADWHQVHVHTSSSALRRVETRCYRVPVPGARCTYSEGLRPSDSPTRISRLSSSALPRRSAPFRASE